MSKGKKCGSACRKREVETMHKRIDPVDIKLATQAGQLHFSMMVTADNKVVLMVKNMDTGEKVGVQNMIFRSEKKV